MRRDRDSRGKFVGRGRSLIPQIHSLHHDFENPHHLLKLEFHLEVDQDFLKSQDKKSNLELQPLHLLKL